MRVDQLGKLMQDRYDLVCFEDLAALRSTHGAIFQLFRRLRQDSFRPNQRLVLYTDQDPESSFLDHVQRAAISIDISNFFILIVCPYDINQKLVEANEKFGNDDIVIGSRQQDLTGCDPWPDAGFADPRYLCPLPFSQVTLDPSGAARPCCKFQGFLGHNQQQDLSTIFVDTPFQNIRTQMIKGKAPSQCSTCWQEEQQGTTSMRQLALQKYSALLDQQWLDDPQIRDLSWTAGSLCNFTCRICSPWVSSSIATEEIKNSQDQSFVTKTKRWTALINNAESQDEIIKTITTLEHIEFLHILGGEPLMWPRLPYLVDTLVAHKKAGDITLEINTNGSWFPRDLLLDITAHFKAFEILISIDSVGDRFELERGGRWQDVLDNIRAFTALRSDTVKIKLAPTVNLQNVFYLDDVVDLAAELDLGIVWCYLVAPDFLNINSATKNMQDLVAQKFQDHSHIELRRIAQRVASASAKPGEQFLDYVRRLDQRRNQNFATTHPEVWKAMGGCAAS